MMINVHIKSLEEFRQFKNIVRILNQKFDQSSLYKGTDSDIFDPENPYYNFCDDIMLSKQCWMKASLRWIEYQKEKTILSLDEFDKKYNPYDSLLIDKAEDYIKDKEGTDDYLNGLFKGFIDGYIKYIK